jgi:predicted transcriptional regulator
MKKLSVNVGSLRDMGDRFAIAFNRAQAGENIEQRNVTFLSWEALTSTLPPTRLELLRHLHRHGAESIKALAESLDRDYKRVHEDVVALEAAGMIVREGNRLSAPWDAVSAEVTL